MDPLTQHQHELSRRAFLGKAATGVGTAALALLLGREQARAAAPAPVGGLPGLPGYPHWAPRAKNIIYLFQNGAPTHVDLFDYKPKLKELHGRAVPDEYVAGKRFSTMTGKADGKLLLAPIEPFHQRGSERSLGQRIAPVHRAGG